MKYCKYRIYQEPRGNTTAVYNYVTLEDIQAFHGKTFKDQFHTFISVNLKPTLFGKEQGYFYIDYQFYAQRTKLYLLPE